MPEEWAGVFLQMGGRRKKYGWPYFVGIVGLELHCILGILGGTLNSTHSPAADESRERRYTPHDKID
ncbi:Hypothetical predicted protein [Scomber scombrus]|uniref:Uncharacterized protein n=1 Tax=Scomber scombrus TaxID=13677 RepID=A0AAV1PX15_SCOSC